MKITDKRDYAASESESPKAEVSKTSTTTNAVAVASIIGGTALAAYGILRKSWAGAALAAGGAYLAYSGLNDMTKPYSGKVRLAFTIGAPPEDVYAFVHDPANWRQFLQGLAMESSGDGALKLTFGEAAGFKVTSQANITDEQPGKFIAWSSDNGPLQHHGALRFHPAPGERGTELSISFEFKAPAGPIGRTVAQFVGWDPEQLVRESLRHLKQILEAGEIPSTKNQSVGARGIKGAALRVLYREGSSEDAANARMAGD